jgi:hypothetical protein
MGIDPDRARRLAGLPSVEQAASVDVRAAIQSSDDFTPRQKDALLELVDSYERANRAHAVGPDSRRS